MLPCRARAPSGSGPSTGTAGRIQRSGSGFGSSQLDSRRTSKTTTSYGADGSRITTTTSTYGTSSSSASAAAASASALPADVAAYRQQQTQNW